MEHKDRKEFIASRVQRIYSLITVTLPGECQRHSSHCSCKRYFLATRRRTKKNGERKGDGNRFIGITRIRNDANIFRWLIRQ